MKRSFNLRSVLHLLLAVSSMIVVSGRQSLEAQLRQSQEATAHLVRCSARTLVPCVVVEASAVASTRASNDSWSLQLGPPSFLPLEAGKPSTYSGPIVYLLILLDVSGSMDRARFAAARAALAVFLKSDALQKEAKILVAVAPFGDKAVAQTIKATAFTSANGALRQLEAIPDVKLNTNTGLYSAVVAGSEHLGAQPVPGRRRALLIVTDGENDPRDNSLLQNNALPRAMDAMRNNVVEPFLLGLGSNLPEPQLDSLAIGSAKPYITAEIVFSEIASRLTMISADIFAQQDFVYATAADVSSLGRIVRHNAITRGDRQRTVSVRWSPPLLALPAFDGVMESSSLGELPTLNALDGAPVERIVYAMMLMLLCAVMWGVVPRWIWPPVVLEREALRERIDAVDQGVGGAGEVHAGLLRHTKEAPPRSATEVTGEFPTPRSL